MLWEDISMNGSQRINCSNSRKILTQLTRADKDYCKDKNAKKYVFTYYSYLGCTWEMSEMYLFLSAIPH